MDPLGRLRTGFLSCRDYDVGSPCIFCFHFLLLSTNRALDVLFPLRAISRNKFTHPIKEPHDVIADWNHHISVFDRNW